MPLLDVQNLTIRFGGLTAVSNVDLQIEQGQIYSVIGPNGAGKTTVFNAITGIYEPTSGTILFAGQRLERRVSWRVFLFCALVGIVTALTAVAVTANIDDLWRATVKRNYSYATQTFQASAAWQDFWNYLHGDLAVESQPRGRWAVV